MIVVSNIIYFFHSSLKIIFIRDFNNNCKFQIQFSNSNFFSSSKNIYNNEFICSYYYYYYCYIITYLFFILHCSVNDKSILDNLIIIIIIDNNNATLKQLGIQLNIHILYIWILRGYESGSRTEFHFISL